MFSTLKSKVLLLADLQWQKKNPNLMTEIQFHQLKEAIRKAGFLQPIVVSDYDGQHTIVDGHHRVRALTELGRRDAMCLVGTFTPDQQQLLQIGLNRNRGQVQLNVAEEILRELAYEGMSFEEMAGVSSFTQAELETLLTSLPEAPKHAPLDTSDVNTDLPSRPFVLEIPLQSAKQLVAVKRALRKASGKANDISLGLLNALGMVK